MNRSSIVETSWRAVALFAAAAVWPASLMLAQKGEIQARIIAPEKAAAGSSLALTVEMKIGPNLHVNSHAPTEKYLIATDVTLAASIGTLSPIRYPKDVEKRFSFADKPLRVYAGTVRFDTDLQIPPGATAGSKIAGTLSYQACNDQQCFPPSKIPLEASIAVSGGTGSH